jgi:hypothetical protein
MPAKPPERAPLTPEQVEAKTRENRSRRAAQRQGYKLAKIQRRDPRALGWNRWLLTDHRGKLLISHIERGTETGASLDEVEDHLGVPRETGDASK